MDSAPGAGPQTSGFPIHARLTGRCPGAALTHCSRTASSRPPLFAQALLTHACPTYSPRAHSTQPPDALAHGLPSTSPLASAPPSPDGRGPSPRGSPPPFPSDSELTAEGFPGLHAVRTRALHACASCARCVRLCRPSPHCPPTSVQLCHLPRPSVVSLSVHELRHAAHVGRLKSHPPGPAALPPKAPGSGACPRPSRPPPLSPKHSQWKPLNFFPSATYVQRLRNSFTFGYVHELREICILTSPSHRRFTHSHLVSWPST